MYTQTVSALSSVLRTSFSENDITSARNRIEEAVDWPLFSELAAEHNVIPLAFRGLKSIHAESLVPRQTAGELAETAQAVACNNMLIAGKVAQICRALSRGGVDVIPMRGVALAARLYGDLNLRMFGDIDVLVKPSDLSQAVDLLSTIGIKPNREYKGKALRKLIRSDCEWHFHTPEGTHVELHWRVFPRNMRFAAFERGLWDRCGEGAFMGSRIKEFDAADLAIMLAIHHGGKHRWCELRHVCDFRELMRTGDVDWETVVARARTTGALRHVLTGFTVVREILGDPIPEAVWDAHRGDPVAEQNGVELAKCLYGETTRISSEPPVLYYIHQRRRLRDKLRYTPWLSWWLIVCIFQPTEKELRYLRLPTGLRFLLVPFRLVRLLVKYLSLSISMIYSERRRHER